MGHFAVAYGTSAVTLGEVYAYIIEHYLSGSAPADTTLTDLLLSMGAAISSHGSGSVTTVSVVSANGLAGTVANPTSTPAITMSTSITGLLKGNGTAISAATAGTDYLTPSGNGSSLTGLTVSQVSGAAPLANPTFTGTPAAPTATPGTNSTQLATTAFVATSFAPTASPTFSGTPAGPTASLGTNTTQLATTAFVQAGAPVNIVSTTFTSNAYTLALSDAMSAQQASNGSTAASVTVPTNASVAFPVGTVITFTQTGTGKISITAAGGVTITSSVSGGFVSGTTGCRAEYSTIGLLKTATNTWVLSGDAA